MCANGWRMIKPVLVCLDEAMIGAVDDVVRWLQYRCKVRYASIVGTAVFGGLSIVWLSAYQSFSDVGDRTLVFAGHAAFSAMGLVALFWFSKVYGPSWREMTVPRFERLARLAISNRQSPGPRFVLVGFILVNLMMQVLGIFLGGDAEITLSRFVAAMFPLLIIHWVVCSMPLIAQEKLQQFFREME